MIMFNSYVNLPEGISKNSQYGMDDHEQPGTM